MWVSGRTYLASFLLFSFCFLLSCLPLACISMGMADTDTKTELQNEFADMGINIKPSKFTHPRRASDSLFSGKTASHPYHGDQQCEGFDQGRH